MGPALRAGADRFVFSNGYGNDRVADFEVGVDRIDLRGLLAITSFAQLKAAAIDTSDGVLIQGAATLLIEGVKEAELSAGDFIF